MKKRILHIITYLLSAFVLVYIHIFLILANINYDYLIDNEDMLDQLIEDIEKNLTSSSLEHAIVMAASNLRPPSKYDKDIFVYNMNLNRKQNYERFKKSPSGFMDDMLHNMISQYGDDMR